MIYDLYANMSSMMYKCSFIFNFAKFVYLDTICKLLQCIMAWHIEGLAIGNAFGYDTRKVDGYENNGIYGK